MKKKVTIWNYVYDNDIRTITTTTNKIQKVTFHKHILITGNNTGRQRILDVNDPIGEVVFGFICQETVTDCQETVSSSCYI